MSLTKQELIEVREYVAKGGSAEAELLARKLTEEIGDKNEYYDIDTLIETYLHLLDDDQLWEALGFIERISNGEYIAPFLTGEG